MWRNVGLGVGIFAKSGREVLGLSNVQLSTQSTALRRSIWTSRAVSPPPALIQLLIRSFHAPTTKNVNSLRNVGPYHSIFRSSKPTLVPRYMTPKLQTIWTRHASNSFSRRAGTLRRNKSSISGDETGAGRKTSLDKSAEKPTIAKNKPKDVTGAAAKASSPAASPFLDRLSHLHAPTKEDLLAAASGFWSRLAVRFKWFSIRSGRKFTADEIFGFLSWIFLGHLVWLLIGTTTFLSLFILAVNTVFAQEAMGKWIGGYLTKSSGIRVVFESAIVPKWGDGVISFGKVFVSRRPGQGKAKVEKGSQAAAAAAAAHAGRPEITTDMDDDGNYSQFDITIDTVNVTVSFAKWFNGKGLLKDVEMKGVRGILDRTHVKPTEGYIDPKSYKHEHKTGDFELDSFKMEDLLITVYQPDHFRPFQISVFSCDLPQLRQQWLFYDFMSANNISGAIDNSLFTLHPRQTNNYTESRIGGSSLEPITWKKQTRLRIDNLNIDHLNRGVEGPFSWIRDGNVDIIADIMFPADDDESVAKVLSDVLDRVEATVTTNSIPPTPSRRPEVLTPQAMQAIHEGGEPLPIVEQPAPDDQRYWIMDVKIHLNDVRAAVPFLTKDISYVNNALIRPIVAYINTKRTFIPINCRVVKMRDDFDGSWTMFDSELLDDLNREVYTNF
jgi:distribution and morphology protein 31